MADRWTSKILPKPPCIPSRRTQQSAEGNGAISRLTGVQVLVARSFPVVLVQRQVSAATQLCRHR
jgi:hypothetical protein